MLAVGRLVGIEKTIGDTVISKSTFGNTFHYFVIGYERERERERALASR